jgi:hypothetical protein
MHGLRKIVYCGNPFRDCLLIVRNKLKLLVLIHERILFMIRFAGFLFLFTVAATPGIAQTMEEHKVMASDGEAEDWFGGATAIEGNYAVIGARMDDDNGSSAGAAYLFLRDSSGWTEQQKLLASDGSLDARFGRSVAISGDYVIVGAHKADGDIGAAYVFVRNGSTWSEVAKLSPSDGTSGDFFGTAVGISGDYAVVGAFGSANGGDSSGAAYIYMRTDTTWLEQAKLVPSDADTNDRFGRSVAISGDYVVVGSYGDDDFGGASGSAYVFERSGTVWTETAKLTPGDGSSGAHFGVSASASGDYLIIGAHTEGPDSSGAAYVFKKESGVWTEKAKLVAGDAGIGDEFGISVGITAGSAIVGARLDDDLALSCGSAYLFQESGSVWSEVVKIVPADLDSAAEFGRDVAISATDVLAGALFAPGVMPRTGAAYIYNDITLDVEDTEPSHHPETFRLRQNYPNPFNPATVISYMLSDGGQVDLTIHDLLGQQIKSLVNERQAAGSYTVSWDGTNERGESVAGGVYLFRLKSGTNVEARKMLLLK